MRQLFKGYALRRGVCPRGRRLTDASRKTNSRRREPVAM